MSYGVALALGIGVCAGGLAGCGGSPAPSSLTLRELRLQASAICSATSVRAGRIASPTGGSDAAAFLERGAAVLEAELAQLSALRPPPANLSGYAAAVADLSEIDRMLRAGARDARAGDPVVAFKDLQTRLAPVEARAAGDWSALAIPACATV